MAPVVSTDFGLGGSERLRPRRFALTLRAAYSSSADTALMPASAEASLPAGFSLREAREADCAAIAAIGAHFVRTTLVTWSEGEAECPSEASTLEKLRAARAAAPGSVAAFPWLVCVADDGAALLLPPLAGEGASASASAAPSPLAGAAGAVVGFAYASAFRARVGWRFTCEDSIYVRPGLERRGIGRALLAALVAGCRAAGLRQLVAAISVDGEGATRRGDGLGAASRALHASLGFREAGLLRDAGEKFGRVCDCLFMQKDLLDEGGAGAGAGSAETGAGGSMPER
jgi:L-amino acid N-acyltransferase YncA